MDDHFERLQHSDPESWRIVLQLVRDLNEMNDAIAVVKAIADDASHAKRSESPMPRGVYQVGDLRYAQRRLLSVHAWWTGKSEAPVKRPLTTINVTRKKMIHLLSSSGD